MGSIINFIKSTSLSGVKRFKSHHWFGYFFDNRRAILCRQIFIHIRSELDKLQYALRPLQLRTKKRELSQKLPRIATEPVFSS
jgi:hypothetical protein